jgi:hypothetical protein
MLRYMYFACLLYVTYLDVSIQKVKQISLLDYSKYYINYLTH